MVRYSPLSATPNPLVYTIKARFLAAYSSTVSDYGYPRVFDPNFKPTAKPIFKSLPAQKMTLIYWAIFLITNSTFLSLLETWLELSSGYSYQELGAGFVSAMETMSRLMISTRCMIF